MFSLFGWPDSISEKEHPEHSEIIISMKGKPVRLCYRDEILGFFRGPDYDILESAEWPQTMASGKEDW